MLFAFPLVSSGLQLPVPEILPSDFPEDFSFFATVLDGAFWYNLQLGPTVYHYFFLLLSFYYELYLQFLYLGAYLF